MKLQENADAHGTGGQATSGTPLDVSSTIMSDCATDAQQHGGAKGRGPVAHGTGGQATSGTSLDVSSTTTIDCATDAQQHGAAYGGGAVTPGVDHSDRRASVKQASKYGRDAHTTGLAAWQRISGLTPEAEAKMSRSERRSAIRKLFRHYEGLVREALAEHERETAEEKSERTFLWEPLTAICVELGIARRKLSALTRELTGMAAHEVIDRVRAESLKEKMEAKLAAFFREKSPPGKINFWSQWDLWERLKKSRGNPAYEPVSLAMEYGFANCARLRRGCMLAHGGATPRQLELRVLEKFSEWFKAAAALAERLGEFGEMRWAWVAENEGKPWNDLWTRETEARPDWIARMRALLGLKPELEALAVQTVVPPHPNPRLREACERSRAMKRAEEEQRLRKEEEKRKAEEKRREESGG